MSSEHKTVRRPFSGLKVAAVVIPIMMVSFIAYSWNFHMENIYPLEQISSELDKVNGDLSLSGKIDVMTTMLSKLEPYHGNTEMFGPTSYTDIDQTKQLLKNTATETLTLVSVTDVKDYSYQQGVSNINKHVTEINSRIISYGSAMGFNTAINPLGWIIGLVFGFSPIIILGAWALDERRYQRTMIRARQ